MRVNRFGAKGLRPIKEVMGRNLVDRRQERGYGAGAWSSRITDCR